MIRRALVALAILAGASPVAAQSSVEFFPRYDFHLGAEHLSTEDVRFTWDTNFGGDMDLVDYGRGRMTFAANYEAVLGEEFRSFDPNQGNYLLDLSASARTRRVEVAAVLHHISRHLGDRFKRVPVDWNMFGATASRELRRGAVSLRPRGSFLGVLLKSNVDYNWEANGGIDVRTAVKPHVSVIGSGNLRVVGVDGTQNRGTQTGARAEGGIRLEGERGAIELFVAAERRIDAYPLDVSSLSWASAGCRFVSR